MSVLDNKNLQKNRTTRDRQKNRLNKIYNIIKQKMNKRNLSSQFMGSRAQVFLSQQSSQSIQKQHQKKQLTHYKKQNLLLKKQLQQLKSIFQQTRKQLNMYRSMTTKQFTSKQQKNTQMNDVFQMQQQKIFDLETQLQILRDKYNRSVMSNGSVKETDYATKCKELQNRLIKCENQYQREISYLKQKLSRHNAQELIMEKSRSSNFVSSISTQLKPLSKKLNRIDKIDLSKPDIYK